MENRFISTEISRPLASGRERTFSEQRKAFESPALTNRILPYNKRTTVAIDPSKASFLEPSCNYIMTQKQVKIKRVLPKIPPSH